MTRIAVTREFKTKVDADFFLRRRPLGKAKEAKVSVNFGRLDKYASSRDRDLAYITTGLLACEGLVRNGDVTLDDSITFLVQDGSLANPELESVLENLISFLLGSKPAVRIQKVDSEQKAPEERTEGSFDAACLFSGGIDSLSGILRSPSGYGSVFGVFASHGIMSGKVDMLTDQFLKHKGIPVHKMMIQGSGRGLQQFRGPLYLVLAAIAARMHDTKKLILSETGQTMYLPPFSSLDEITLTTHPTMVQMVQQALQYAYGTEFEVYTPFEDLTKAEVVSLCEAPEAIPITNSCYQTQFAYSTYSHCGKCYGCLVRRMSCLVAGVQDAKYAKDVLVKGVGDPVKGRREKKIQVSNLSDLQVILRFARDVLEDKVEDAAQFKIDSFSKQDLYHRFALDVMSSLYLLYDGKGKGQNSWARKFYPECKHDGVITPELARERIEQVREQRFRPDFKQRL